MRFPLNNCKCSPASFCLSFISKIQWPYGLQLFWLITILLSMHYLTKNVVSWQLSLYGMNSIVEHPSLNWNW
jgi:hypothetical protein